MKLYKIDFTHYAPRGSDWGIKEYVLSENDRQVFEYLAKGYANWNDILSDDTYIEEDWESYEEFESHQKQRYEDIFNNKGDYEEELCDLYYGATRYGWEEIDFIDEDDAEVLIRFNIAKRICD